MTTELPWGLADRALPVGVRARVQADGQEVHLTVTGVHRPIPLVLRLALWLVPALVVVLYDLWSAGIWLVCAGALLLLDRIRPRPRKLDVVLTPDAVISGPTRVGLASLGIEHARDGSLKVGPIGLPLLSPEATAWISWAVHRTRLHRQRVEQAADEAVLRDDLKPPPHVVVTREGADRVRVDLPERMVGTGFLAVLLMGGPAFGCLGLPVLLVLGVPGELALGLAILPILAIPFVGVLRPAIRRRLYWTPRALVAEERFVGIRVGRRVVPLDAVSSAGHTETLGGTAVHAHMDGADSVTLFASLDSTAGRWLLGLVEMAAAHRRQQLEGEEVSEGPPPELLALTRISGQRGDGGR